MSAIIPVEFESQRVRVVEIEGQPWFVLTDLCVPLEIKNAAQAAKPLDEAERSMFNIGRQGEVLIVSLPGALTIILRCRDAMKPGTMPYRVRKWITGEVVPRIMRTGAYGHIDPLAILEDPKKMRELLLAYADRAIEAREETASLAHKANALDRLADTGGGMCVTDAAKSLGVQPKRLFHWLMAHEWIYRRGDHGAYAAYQTRLTSGLLKQKVTRLSRVDGTTKLVEQIQVTPKGLAKLASDIGGRP